MLSLEIGEEDAVKESGFGNRRRRSAAPISGSPGTRQCYVHIPDRPDLVLERVH